MSSMACENCGAKPQSDGLGLYYVTKTFHVCKTCFDEFFEQFKAQNLPASEFFPRLEDAKTTQAKDDLHERD
jgi:hypothetical protein